MSDIEKISKRILEFRDARNWKQFHNPKDLAISLVLEAAEVMEHFQWKSAKEVEDHIKNYKADIGEELADVLYWVLLISKDLDIDIVKAVENKMEQNEKKYPVEKAKDNHTKYNRL
jgi:NTP pyrophosphatase (non-canonical NTP hydrolase)